MSIDINFFKKIYSDDIIYHYTKASTAIDFILYNEQLKFHNRRRSNDPTESRRAIRSTVYTGSAVDKKLTKEHVSDTNALHEHASNLEDQFYQICFCKSHTGEDFADEYYFTQFHGHEELFGFTKPRMWEQYADKYSGVCIAFSKKQMLSLNSDKLKLLKGDIEYLTYRELKNRKLGDINGNCLLRIGKERSEKEIDRIVKHSFFCKHRDYQNENEYRIGILYDKNMCCVEQIKGEIVSDKTIMFDVSGCIEAIFMSNYANERQKKDLLDYAYKLHIPIIEMIWQYDSFEPRDYKNRIELINKVFDK